MQTVLGFSGYRMLGKYDIMLRPKATSYAGGAYREEEVKE